MTQDDRQYEAIDVEGGSTGIFGDVNNSVISRDFIVNLVTRDIGRHDSIKGLKRAGTADNKGHALLITCQQGYTDAVQQYLEDGANWRFTEQDEQTCLFKAVHAGHVEIVTLLLSDPERREKLLTKPDRQWLDTPLHRAAIQGHAEIGRILLSYDHPVDPLQRDGLTPLQLAVDKDHVNVVSLLISRGANVRHENYLRDSPLHLAARHGHIDIFRVILAKDSASSFLEQRNIFGDTALFLTGLHNHVDSARLLINHGASVHVANNERVSFLHTIVANGTTTLLAEVIERFSAEEPSARNRWGNTPLDDAYDRGQKECAEILKGRLRKL